MNFLLCITGDIIVVCLKKPTSFLKLESPGKEPVLFPVVTPRTTYALAPKEESGNKRYDAIRSWEGDFDSVAEFLLAITQGMTMPAVSVRYCTLHTTLTIRSTVLPVSHADIYSV